MQLPIRALRAPAWWLAASLCSSAIAADGGRDILLEEIVVTGTLRAQAAQDVPASVTVLDATTLREAGQQHFQDVLGLVPNLNWAGGTSRPRYFQIRGIGEREQYEGAPNPSVGFLIDDIDFSGVGMPATLFDVGQIEVLRGPQGTRYGANALGGLIVVRGNDPQRQPEYTLEATGGDYGTRSLGAAATGPVEALDSAWRFSVQQYQSDGFLTNSTLGRDDTNGRDELTARLKWRSWLDGGGTLDFTLLHADIDNGYDAWSLENTRVTASDRPGTDRQRASAGSVRLERGVGQGGNVLTAIAGYARSKTRYGYDYDWGGPAYWDPYVYDGVENWDRLRRTGSAELRLASPAVSAAGDFAWLAGVHALRLEEEGRYTTFGEFVDPFDAGNNFTDERSLDDDYHATDLALFGQIDGKWSDPWQWSLGLRLEQRRARYRDTAEAQDAPFTVRNRMLGGQASLSRTLGSRTRAYAQVAHGYKAGGFNLGDVPDALRGFGPEYLWNYETGLKTSLQEGRGQADIAVFYQRRRDQQVRSGRQLVGGGPYEFFTLNMPAGYSTGLEGSITLEVLPGLEVSGSLGLLRSRSGGAVNEDGDPIASREAAHAPAYTAAAHVTWHARSGFFARVDVTAKDDFYFDVPTDHDQKAGAHALTNLKVGYGRDLWKVEAWLRNAFDKQYAVRGFYFGNDPRNGWDTQLYRQYGDPRQFGVTAALHF